MKISELLDLRLSGTSQPDIRGGVAIVDHAGLLAGIVTHNDILRALALGHGQDTTVLEAGTADPVVAFPDELLSDAVARMLRYDIGRLPVVSHKDPRRIVGYLGRAEILSARSRILNDELVRERMWRRPPRRMKG